MNKKRQKQIFSTLFFTIFLISSFIFTWFLWNSQMKNIDDFSKDKKQFIEKIEKYKSPAVNNIEAKDILTLEKDLLIMTRDEAIARNAVYTSLISVVGGMFFWITAYMTWRNLISSEEKQITERFSKAVEQLGSKEFPTVMGAIYSLERISKDSEKDYQQTIEILIAFIKNSNSMGNHQDQDAEISQSIQEIMTIIGRRISNPNRSTDEYLDLSYINFTKIKIVDSDLSKVNFRESCFTHGNLDGAKFIGSNLSNSDFSYVNTAARDIVRRSEFTNADLRGANLHEAVLKRSNFEKARMGEANLSKAILSGSKMGGANLVRANMNEADLTGVDLYKVNLSGATLDNTDIGGMDFSTATGLDVTQIKKAKNYQNAIYSSDFKAKLSI